MNNNTAKVKTFEGTWLGVRGIQKTLTGGTLPRGHHVVMMYWLDDAVGNGDYPAGTCTATTVSGDFRFGTGVVHVPVHVISREEYESAGA